MNLPHCFKWIICPLLIGALSLSSAVAAEIEAITKPNADIMLSFVRGGRISKILIKEGTQVKRGQVLVRQDDHAEQIQLQQLKEKAEDTTRIEVVEVELAQKKEDLKKMEWARQDGATTDWEIEHARLEVKTAELSRRMAIFERKQAGLQRDEMQARVKQQILYSPISGQVEEVGIEVGEAAEPLSPVVRIVKIDPLWIDVQVPLKLARQLTKKQPVEVIFPAGATSGAEKISGQIKNIATVADAASDTLRVRVEVPNRSRRPAGERIQVQL